MTSHAAGKGFHRVLIAISATMIASLLLGRAGISGWVPTVMPAETSFTASILFLYSATRMKADRKAGWVGIFFAILCFILGVVLNR